MKNVKVILISVVLCAAVFANARIAALGGDAGFWSGDRANIAGFPATINDHDFVEINGLNDTEAGVNATILWGDATTWGFGFDGTDDDTWMNIYWGNGDVGLNVKYVSSDDGAGATADGFAVSYGQNFDWGELGCGFESMDDASKYWANWRDDMNVWIFDSAKASLVSTDNGAAGAANETGMALGFDMYTHLDAGGADVLFGLGVDYVNVSQDNIGWTSMTLPTASLAVEADLTDWATLRAHVSHSYGFSCTADAGVGASADWGNPCSDDATGADAGNATTYGFGLGFNWGAASLDMEINEDLFTDPVSTMGGWDNGDLAKNDMAITLSYGF